MRLCLNLHWAGQGDEAIAAMKTAMRLDPKPSKRISFTRATWLGYAAFTAGRYDDAISALNQQYERRVRSGSNSLTFLSAAYAATGQDEKARKVMKAFLAKNSGTTLSNYYYPRFYKRPEDKDRLLNLLRKAGMQE